MLRGRLGLDTARLPHADRHGLLWLDRGSLSVEDGCLRFVAAGSDTVASGDYRVPHQTISMILLGPGSTVSHDALRILAFHGTALAAVGEGGIRLYTAQPLGPDMSALARKQATLWADLKTRIDVARKMYAWRLGEILPHRDIAVLRGIEGSRVRERYRLEAEKTGVPWQGRRFDRANPSASDLPNQAINNATTAVNAAAGIAVAATGTIPQLGFIHEESGQSFILDVGDLFREDVAIHVAFRAVKVVERNPHEVLERVVRKMVAERMRKEGTIPLMIDRIKSLFEDP